MAKVLVCRFCGKTHLNVENKTFKTNKEAEEYATLNCSCEKGESYRNQATSLENLNNFLNSTSYNDEIKEFLKTCGLHILKYPEDSLTYQFENVKIKFVMKKSKLKIEITETEKTERTF